MYVLCVCMCVCVVYEGRSRKYRPCAHIARACQHSSIRNVVQTWPQVMSACSQNWRSFWVADASKAMKQWRMPSRSGIWTCGRGLWGTRTKTSHVLWQVPKCWLPNSLYFLDGPRICVVCGVWCVCVCVTLHPVRYAICNRNVTSSPCCGTPTNQFVSVVAPTQCSSFSVIPNISIVASQHHTSCSA